MAISKISLHVFGHNKIAISLYQKTGYEITNVLMSKTL
jgi:ribosomal protein S18 acetylase RimI-like enzyme